MYGNLSKAMKECNVTQKMISEALGIHYNTVCQKINGSSDFEIQEFLKIWRIWFRQYSLEYLATKSDSEKTA